MSGSIGSSPPSGSNPFSFKQFDDLIAGIELLYQLGRRLSAATTNQSCEYLIQEAKMAFVKTMMGVLGFLRFIQSSRYHAREIDVVTDLSSASVMARQVFEDALSFLYLSEPSLTQDQKEFRALVWRYCGAKEALDSARFAGVFNPGISPAAVERANFGQQLENPPFKGMLESIESGRRGRIRQGRENHVLHDREILQRRGIQTETYDLYSKVLSNFAHFSTFSHQLMTETSAEWEKSWRAFLPPAICVANFLAEAIEVFLETFPQTRGLLKDYEPPLIANFRSWLRNQQS
jgi:hypothetical protein